MSELAWAELWPGRQYSRGIGACFGDQQSTYMSFSLARVCDCEVICPYLPLAPLVFAAAASASRCVCRQALTRAAGCVCVERAMQDGGECCCARAVRHAEGPRRCGALIVLAHGLSKKSLLETLSSAVYHNSQVYANMLHAHMDPPLLLPAAMAKRATFMCSFRSSRTQSCDARAQPSTRVSPIAGHSAHVLLQTTCVESWGVCSRCLRSRTAHCQVVPPCPQPTSRPLELTFSLCCRCGDLVC